MIKYSTKHINNVNPVKRNSGVSKMTDELDKVIEKIKLRVEREIPDKGYFRSFAEDYANKSEDLFAKAVSISIERDRDNEGKARLIIALLHPKMNVDASAMLIHSDKKSILNYMNQDGFKQEVQQMIKELSDSLREY